MLSDLERLRVTPLPPELNGLVLGTENDYAKFYMTLVHGYRQLINRISAEIRDGLVYPEPPTADPHEAITFKQDGVGLRLGEIADPGEKFSVLVSDVLFRRQNEENGQMQEEHKLDREEKLTEAMIAQAIQEAIQWYQEDFTVEWIAAFALCQYVVNEDNSTGLEEFSIDFKIQGEFPAILPEQVVEGFNEHLPNRVDLLLPQYQGQFVITEIDGTPLENPYPIDRSLAIILIVCKVLPPAMLDYCTQYLIDYLALNKEKTEVGEIESDETKAKKISREKVKESDNEEGLVLTERKIMNALEIDAQNARRIAPFIEERMIFATQHSLKSTNRVGHQALQPIPKNLPKAVQLAS